MQEKCLRGNDNQKGDNIRGNTTEKTWGKHPNSVAQGDMLEVSDMLEKTDEEITDKKSVKVNHFTRSISGMTQ